MKAKLMFIVFIAGLMGGFLSPAWASVDGRSDAFNKIYAKSGTTVSSLFHHYHKSGGQYSYEEFLAAYCTLQGMKSCEDADFRKLPVGYWKVPAAPVFTTTKHAVVPAVSIATPVIAPTVTTHVVVQQPVTQPAAKIPPVSLQTFATPKVEQVAKQAEKVAAAQSVTPAAQATKAQSEPASSYFGAFAPPIIAPAVPLSVPTEVPARKVRMVAMIKGLVVTPITSPLWVLPGVVVLLALCISYGMWSFFKKKFEKDTEALAWHRNVLRTDNENLVKERDQLLYKQREAADIVAELSHELVQTTTELMEAQTVAQRFDLPEGLLRENFIPFIYLVKTPMGRVVVGNTPDPMQLSSVRNHLMNNEWSRKFYGITFAHSLSIAPSVPAASAG